jgi:hypothetical protein
MLQGNRSESERGDKLAQARPTLVARLRLFGMLAVLGPLFAVLNSVVLESVPQVEVRFIAAESTQPATDVVVVERVVDRLVYVPVDNLSVATPQSPAAGGLEPSESPTGVAGIGETTDDTASEAVADKTETEAPPAVSVEVRPVVYAPSFAADNPVVDEAAEAEAEDVAEPAEAVAEETPVDEPAVAATPRPIIIHTMFWNGEQFVQSADVTVRAPEVSEAADGEDVEAGEEWEIVADDEELAEDSEIEYELVEVAEDEDMTTGDEPEGATADESSDEPVQVMSADGAGGLEQIAAAVGEVEETVAAESSEQLEQAVEASNEPEDVAEAGDETEPVAVEESADEPSEDDATRARVESADAESTPTPTN